MKSDNYCTLCADQKKLTKNIYKRLIFLKVETVFMNTENSKTNQPHRFRLPLTDKLNLKSPNKNMALANLSIYYTWKNTKSECNNNKFKISAPTWIILLISLMVLILLQTFRIILNLSSKNYETLTGNPPVQIDATKIKSRIVFKIKGGYKLELLSPETIRIYKERC